MADRDQRNNRNQKRRQPDRDLHQRPFKELRNFKVGPLCLKCNERVDTRRQGNGYVHRDCEPKRGQQPVLYVVPQGDDDLILCKVAAEEELAEVTVSA